MEMWENGLFPSVQELSCYRIHLEYGKSEILLPGRISVQVSNLPGKWPNQQVPGYSGSAEMKSAPGELSDYLVLTVMFLVLMDI